MVSDLGDNVDIRELNMLLEYLGKKGIYTLIINVPSEKSIIVGKLGERRFPEGYYAYTGSALGKASTSLGNRLLRHLKSRKTLRWHIDYLTSVDDIRILKIALIFSNRNLECEVNSLLCRKLNAEIIAKGFGSSDCRSRCESHLLFLGDDIKALNDLEKLYRVEFGPDFKMLNLND